MSYRAKCNAIESSLSASFWLKANVKLLDARDPLDAARDAKALSDLAIMRLDEALGRAG